MGRLSLCCNNAFTDQVECDFSSVGHLREVVKHLHCCHRRKGSCVIAVLAQCGRKGRSAKFNLCHVLYIHVYCSSRYNSETNVNEQAVET